MSMMMTMIMKMFVIIGMYHLLLPLRLTDQKNNQHNIDIQPEAVDIQVEQNDIDNDNDEDDSLCVDDPESVRVSHALSRLYDFKQTRK